MLTKVRGARSIANLKRGGSTRGGRPRKDDTARRIARRLLNRPKYRQTLAQKLDDCTLHPSVHVALMYYAWGRPTEFKEITQAVPVRIVHEYSSQ